MPTTITVTYRLMLEGYQTGESATVQFDDAVLQPTGIAANLAFEQGFLAGWTVDAANPDTVFEVHSDDDPGSSTSADPSRSLTSVGVIAHLLAPGIRQYGCVPRYWVATVSGAGRGRERVLVQALAAPHRRDGRFSRSADIPPEDGKPRKRTGTNAKPAIRVSPGQSIFPAPT
ncbi:MAG: hypothetical protein ACFCVC_19965 [Acidimicrobiia bacterium]